MLFPNLPLLITPEGRDLYRCFVQPVSLRTRYYHYYRWKTMVPNSFTPQWILDSFKTRNKSLKIINQLDLLVIPCVVLTFGDLLRDHRVWFWFGNCAALSGAIHGYVRTPHLTQLSNEIHLLFTNLHISVWFEWVPTECNVSDITNRSQGPEEYEFYEREGFERWKGDMFFPSTENVESHDLDLLK